jgi:cyclin A|eukprot:CAMPEP_0174295416 /NCGR_PEP_ID=MMETSP0809-20121228/44653_1 /TAXON_ID=73025 ORGANISM="Eutreptiella gymnastica-like, Strain CCMP1594" /NCGR_SAMPLE_ID=MMETSP0809 /ASSEMBLY_ACC=CAM_ASM_000658 /LENGTH=399 /DNA_ID=CAMNT_0015397671 /DNA_START=20 /DNA_END=1219 /DNA_ORIENTATION=+
MWDVHDDLSGSNVHLNGDGAEALTMKPMEQLCTASSMRPFSNADPDHLLESVLMLSDRAVVDRLENALPDAGQGVLRRAGNEYLEGGNAEVADGDRDESHDALDCMESDADSGEVTSVESSDAPEEAPTGASALGQHMDPSLCADVYMAADLAVAEVKYAVNVDYMRIQPHFTAQMRGELVDWLVSAHDYFGFSPSTLYLGISLMDRCFSKMIVPRSKLQLIGIVSLWIAAKYDAVYRASIDDIVDITADEYSRTEIAATELQLLRSLEFSLTYPTIYPYLTGAMQVAQAAPIVQQMALYFSELAVLDYSMLGYRPSMIAAACFRLACILCHEDKLWNGTLASFPTYDRVSLQPIMRGLLRLVRSGLQDGYGTIYQKYSSSHRLHVSRLADAACTNVVL